MPVPAPYSPSLVVLFDGGCPICRRTVRTLQRLDWFRRLQFADATNPTNRERVAPGLTASAAMQQMYVVDPHGRRHGGYDAQVRLARELPALWPFWLVGGLPGVRQIGTAVYRHVAANRQRHGHCSDELCSPPYRPQAPGPRPQTD
jgi:predicted DCC family thiol-disulfide oxidoreductase YuxK